MSGLDYFLEYIDNTTSSKIDEIETSMQDKVDAYRGTKLENVRQKLEVEKVRAFKDIESSLLISKAQINNDVKLQTLNAQFNALNDAISLALQQLAEFSKTPEYKPFLKDLIIEGLITLRESNVYLMIRKEDVEIVQQILPEAIKSASEKLDTQVNAKIHDKNYLAAFPKCAGGVVLLAKKGKIRLSNVVNDRLRLAFQQGLPIIRKILSE